GPVRTPGAPAHRGGADDPPAARPRRRDLTRAGPDPVPPAPTAPHERNPEEPMSKQNAYARGSATSAPPVRVGLDELRAHCAAVLAAGGLGGDDAALVADSLVDAEARGISSHGVTRTRIYTERLRAGMLDPKAEPTVVRRT